MTTVQTHAGTAAEARVAQRLREALSTRDLSRYAFTEVVEVREGDDSFSHPILTIGTPDRFSDERQLLATYVHEQLHWYLVGHPQQYKSAKEALRMRYPKAPNREYPPTFRTGLPEIMEELRRRFPKGPSVAAPPPDRAPEPDFVHMVLCPLEHQAMCTLLGPEDALELLQVRQVGSYRWIRAE